MSPRPPNPAGVYVWRHPRPQGAAGRCIGRTDLLVDPRKAKRLAHRIRHCMRREGGPRVVVTSPLQRGASVGRWLKAWGWMHVVDERLSEMDFGHWDGRRWDDIGAAAVGEWCADFAHHAPGGAESVARLLQRCGAFVAQLNEHSPRCIVGHAGWISAAAWLSAGRDAGAAAGLGPCASDDANVDASAAPNADPGHSPGAYAREAPRPDPTTGFAGNPSAATWPAAVAYGARVQLAG